MREEVTRLASFGILVSEADESPQGEETLKNQDALIRGLQKMRPATDEEACLLTSIFGVDDCFGLAWSLLHFIETSPNWPVESCMSNLTSEVWKKRLAERYENKELVLEARIRRDQRGGR